MITAILSLSLAVAKFDGGDAGELAQCLQMASRRPVSISVLQKANWKSFEFDLADSYTFSVKLKAETQLSQCPGVQMAFSDRLVPRSFIEIDPVYQASTASPFSTFEVNQAVKDGKVTLSPPKGASLDRSLLGRINFTKPLKMHWMLDGVFFPTFAMDMPEREFLQLVAKATGMLLLNTKANYLLDLDPAEFQLRASNTFRRFAVEDSLKTMSDSKRWSFEIARFAIGVADKDSIRKAFEMSGSSAMIVLNNSNKQQLYSQLTRYAQQATSLVNRQDRTPRNAQLRPAPNAGVASENGAMLVPAFMSQVNWNNDVAIVLRSNFQVRVIGFSSAGARNRPGRQIMLDFGRG